MNFQEKQNCDKINENTQVNRNKILGNYTLSFFYQSAYTLGQGTFGTVKKAIHNLTNQPVAIKILQKNKIVDVADVERVSREIHILKIIRHPNIIQLYEIIETPKQLFLVTQFAEHGQLFDYIVKQKKIKEKQSCMFFQQLVSSVEYLHKLNIVHRDLKPENILLDFNKNIKVIDFGLSNTYNKNQSLKTACGSPCYAAPQMIKGNKYVGIEVDIWSLGIILFVMLCGYLPFEDPNTSKLYNKILNGQYKIPEFVSPQATHLLKRILELKPSNRITIPQIKNHDWWKLHNQSKMSSGIIVGYNKIPLDMTIINNLYHASYKSQQTDYSKDYIRKCLEVNRHNSITTMYYLLLKSHLKKGGVSNADLSSQFFDKRLIEPIFERRKRSQFFLSALKQLSVKQLLKDASVLQSKNVFSRSFRNSKSKKINYQNHSQNASQQKPSQTAFIKSIYPIQNIIKPSKKFTIQSKKNSQNISRKQNNYRKIKRRERYLAQLTYTYFGDLKQSYKNQKLQFKNKNKLIHF